jgi:hypothetical protein
MQFPKHETLCSFQNSRLLISPEIQLIVIYHHQNPLDLIILADKGIEDYNMNTIYLKFLLPNYSIIIFNVHSLSEDKVCPLCIHMWG